MNFLTKSCLAILTLTLAAVYAEATPAVGDHAVFAVTLSKGTQSLSGKLTFDLTSYEKGTDSWVKTSTMNFNGQKQVQTDKVVTSDLLADAAIDAKLANCAAQKGTPETVHTPAGDFPSCATPVTKSNGSGKIWVAKVPFGYCKWILNRTDGVTINAVLESYVNGAK